MNINWTTVEQSLSGVAAIAKEFAPALTLAGPMGAAAAAVISNGATVAENVLAAAEAAGSAVSSGDLASIRASAASIQEQNALLAEQIAAS